MSNLQSTIQWAKAGLSYPGCWAYPDMLEVGCHGLPPVEGRSHFNAWCIVSSPLILSMDLRDDAVMDASWPVITNAEALAVSKAWAGMSGTVFQAASATVQLGRDDKSGEPFAAVPAWQYFYKPIDGKSVAVLLMNHDSAAVNFVLTFANIPGCDGTTSYKLRDINAHADLGSFTGTWSINNVASHDAVFLMVTPA